MGQMGQMKKQGKHLQDQINDEEIDYLPNIDNKDNPKPQKQKGGTDQENRRNVYQRPRRTKGQTVVNNTTTERKNTLQGINN